MRAPFIDFTETSGVRVVVQLGLVGCGKQAEKHAAALRTLGVDLVVADLDRELAERFAADFDARSVEHPVDLFNDATVAGIDICTPTPSHLALCLDAIEAGLPFFVEKPLCLSVAEARKIAEAASAAGVPGGVGYIYRFVPSIEVARTAVQSGAMGELTHATFHLGGRGNHQPWKHTRALGGGAISEMMVHMIDLAIWFFGEVVDVDLVQHRQLLPMRSFGGAAPIAVDAEDLVSAVVRCSAGPDVLVHADLASGAFHQGLEVHGTNGVAVASIDSQVNTHVSLIEARAGFDAGRTSLPPTGDLYVDELGEFVELVRSGESGSLRSTVADSVLLMRAMDTLRKVIEDERR